MSGADWTPETMTWTPIGWQGAAAHTWTPGCDGAHPIAERCAGTRPAAPGTAGGAQEAATPLTLAAGFERLAAEHSQKAAEYDRDHEMECFHRGCAAGLTVAAGKVRDLAPAWDALAAENERLRAGLRELAASWAEPVKMATATHDELVEQAEREQCARGLLAILGEVPGA